MGKRQKGCRASREAVGSASSREWSRGFFCALAKLIDIHGTTTPDMECLFSGGGDPQYADEIDQAVFKRHGLMPNTEGQPRPALAWKILSQKESDPLTVAKRA